MKRFLVFVFMALVIGCSLAYFMFSRENGLDSEKVFVKAFQVGVFTNYDNALRVADRNNGIVVSDEGVFRVYVSILSDEKAIDSMRKYYDEIGLDYYLKEISVSREFFKSIKTSEKLLKDSGKDAYNVINLSVLSEYEELL